MDNYNKIILFEEELDKELHKLKVFDYLPDDIITYSMLIIENIWHENQYIALSFINGFQIIMSEVNKIKYNNSFSPKKGVEILSHLIEDLEFANHYHMLREILYYTYNSANAIKWHFDNNIIEIEYIDKSLPRQFFKIANNFHMGSYEIFKDYSNTEKIIELIKNGNEFELSEDNLKAMEFIKEEVSLKFTGYYLLCDKNDDLSLGKYTFQEFYNVYESLLIKALYHRYYSKLYKECRTSVIIDYDELIQGLIDDCRISRETAVNIINDIVYDYDKKIKALQPIHYSLYKIGKGKKIAMCPYHFTIWEAFICIFRIIAIKNPNHYLINISQYLSERFVSIVKSMFEKQGFKCFSNVKLSKYDPQLPDIDLMVISSEPTLGYFIYFCELKNPIPPTWAKEHLKAREDDMIPKAIIQIDKIVEFIGSLQGYEFLDSKLHDAPRGHLPRLENKYLVACSSLVITSNNAGMFFDNKNNIVDYKTLGQILDKCDGDIAYVQYFINNLNNICDDHYKLEFVEFMLGTTKIKYQGTALKDLLSFPQNEYKSCEIVKNEINNMLNEGYHPWIQFGVKEEDFS